MLMLISRPLRLFAILLIVSLSPLVAPARHHHSGSSSSRSRAAKSKSRTARRGSSRYDRSPRYARYARYARYGRRGHRSRWRRQVVRTSFFSSGVHNFLTSSWTQAVSETPGSERAATAPSMSSEGSVASSAVDRIVMSSQPPAGPAPVKPQPTPVPSASAAALGEPAAPGTITVPVNPLVAAFSASLNEHGYSADNQGYIVETLDGTPLAENNADIPFNPASVTKVATSMVAISKLGPDYRFRTMIYTDGTVDKATGTLHGSLYVMGSGDPAFFTENAWLIADQLNQHGIRSVDGNLIVEGQFYFNFSASRDNSAKALKAAFATDPDKLVGSSAFQRFLSMRGIDPANSRVSFDGQGVVSKAVVPAGAPTLKIQGDTITQPGINTARLKLLAVHTSLPLVRVLKGQNDFSNNWMATVIGDLVGGPDAVDRYLEQTIGLRSEEVRIVTSSGLGTNMVSPRAMAQVIRKLAVYLAHQNIGLDQLLPVAGVDHGTLQRRFTDAYRSCVVAKTGTLHNVSALAGLAFTRSKGPLVFVIFNHGGSPASFRYVQDETIKKLIELSGGPAPIHYEALY